MSEANKTTPRYRNRQCDVCGKDFLAYNNPRQCPECRKKYERAYHEKYRQAHAKENGRICCVCGKPLYGRQTLYCSRKCLDQARKNTSLKKQAVMLPQSYISWDADPYDGKALYFDGLHSLRSREPGYCADPAWGF